MDESTITDAIAAIEAEKKRLANQMSDDVQRELHQTRRNEEAVRTRSGLAEVGHRPANCSFKPSAQWQSGRRSWRRETEVCLDGNLCC